VERPPVAIHEAAENGDAGGNDGDCGLDVSPDPEVNRVDYISLLVSVIPARRERLWTGSSHQSREKAWPGSWQF
jgi:hypothetical protein